MEQITNYGKLTQSQLRDELVQVVATLHSRLRELGGIQSDYNRVFYDAYAREPSTSVAGKERAAEFACLEITRDRNEIEADLRALTAQRDLIVTILPYANS